MFSFILERVAGCSSSQVPVTGKVVQILDKLVDYNLALCIVTNPCRDKGEKKRDGGRQRQKRKKRRRKGERSGRKKPGKEKNRGWQGRKKVTCVR